VRVQFGDFTFDGDARELRHRSDCLHLTPKAFDLLGLLVRERPRAVSKDQLREELWPDVTVDEANLKNLVVEIRSVLGGGAIRTVHRYGYAFEAVAEGPRTPNRLVASSGVYPLNDGENVIGRDNSCSVVLQAPGISRRHAVIRLSPSAATLEDLGSKNGTWRNDERVEQPQELRNGDRIRIGGVEMVFRTTATESTATIND